MIDVYEVEIVTIGRTGIINKYEQECTNKVEAVRYLLSYKPKRGYKIVEFNVRKGGRLV